VVGLVESMLGEGEMENYSADLSTTAQSIIAGIGKEGQEGAIHETFRQLEQISKNLAAVSLSTQVLLEKSSGDIQRTMKNLSQITDGIAKSNKNIESLLKNVDKISQDIAAAEVDETAKRVNNNLDELKLTLNQTSQTLTELNSVIKKADQGDGSVAKLLNDAKLYENMEATTRQLNLLLQDLRLNPKRYAHFSVFGKKNQNYTLPADDPANK
jgi:phospholipid/cholesterol/gamma-HCH transport system substrate-binding protein